jgi:hypothetical protein
MHDLTDIKLIDTSIAGIFGGVLVNGLEDLIGIPTVVVRHCL